MPCRSVRQVTEIARLWVVRRGAIVSAGTVRQESDTACPSERGMGSSLSRSRTPRLKPTCSHRALIPRRRPPRHSARRSRSRCCFGRIRLSSRRGGYTFFFEQASSSFWNTSESAVLRGPSSVMFLTRPSCELPHRHGPAASPATGREDRADRDSPRPVRDGEAPLPGGHHSIQVKLLLV